MVVQLILLIAVALAPSARAQTGTPVCFGDTHTVTGVASLDINLRGLAVADFDGDGDLDVAVCTYARAFFWVCACVCRRCGGIHVASEEWLKFYKMTFMCVYFIFASKLTEAVLHFPFKDVQIQGPWPCSLYVHDLSRCFYVGTCVYVYVCVCACLWVCVSGN